MSRVLATEAEVLALSPDAASSKAAKGLQSISKWPTVGSNEAAAWGECQGSGSKPYQTQVDLSGPSFKCSCPSRKFPCKHGLALMLLRAAGQVTEGGESPEWVNSWLASRQGKAEKKEAKAAEAAAAPPPSPEAIAKREDKRWDKIAAGMAEVSLWSQDMVRHGLANLAGDAQARQQWNNMAARMVDAQAPGMSARIKEASDVVDSHPGWPKDLLTHLAHWQLLVDAVQRRETLPAPIKADVMAALGWPMDKAEVQAAGAAVADEWLVVGLRMIEREGRLLERRVWLQGLQTGRMALVLDYSQGGRGFESAWLQGRVYRCGLHFYPSNAPLRAMAANGNAEALLEQGGQTMSRAKFNAPLTALAQRVAANPLQMMQPLWCGKASLQVIDNQWLVAWPQSDEGAAEAEKPLQSAPVPAAISDSEAWRLLALTGGAPMQLFGEWEQGRWRLLSAWQVQNAAPADDAEAAQALHCIWQNRGEML